MPHRVALVVPGFPKISETFVVSKFLGLLDRGWDAHVVCEKSEEADWAAFSQLANRPDIRRRVHVAWPHRPRWLAGALLVPALLRSFLARPSGTWRWLSRAISRHGAAEAFRRFYLDADLVRLAPDIVHFEFGPLAAERISIKPLLGCRVVVSFRGYDLNYVGLDDPRFYDEVWKLADGIHCLGEDLWRRALRRGCPPSKRHALISPAVDAEYFRPDAVPARPPSPPDAPLRILSVGRIEWKKGYEDALQAVRRLLDGGTRCEYRIIGSGAYLGAVAFARYQLGLVGIAEFLGSAPREDVRAEMAQADVFLHAAVSEGFCNAVLEAQAMGVPVVSTDADGLSENVRNGVTGFVVPRRNPEALARAIADLARDPALRARMGAAGREHALQSFRPKAQIEAFDRLYRDVLEEPPQARPEGSEGDALEQSA